MKKIILGIVLISIINTAFGQTVDLNGVTFGFGAGYSHTFDKTYDYSLTPDANHNLKLQPLSKDGFVISSVIMVKLGKIAVNQDNNSFVKSASKGTKANFWEHMSINLALNLVNVAPDISFNKNIDGGLGLGYFISDNLQVAVFYDVSRVRQLRDYVISTYQDKSIPNGTDGNYNSLDANDNNLFYNKTVSGWSVKLIFSIANKKAD
ncbi:hypothetical protein [Mucilaginibacter sp.]|jgi:hypothetical protein|uniref:hypothetical protein n=1 Tax=Mucilaginibacter sp. TaxID=1882438 RepID=UPI002BFE3945|nr:hypothetical protein [Mucilaginibacter sp.]HTI58575.1 hypothetical protein [Mucilaginibacter sp.]